MAKKLLTADFEINASRKMLYPYMSTASGLAQWFADDVLINEDKVFNFIWDEEDHKAKMVNHRTNHFVKFEFFPDGEDDQQDPPYFELRIEVNELTQTVFLHIADYADFDDEEEQYEVWEGLVTSLKETVGG